MKFNCPLLATKDMNRSVEFYKRVLGLRVIRDFGANKTLTGGIALQTEETWSDFIGGKPVIFRGNDAELYFEEEKFDDFAKRLAAENVTLVHAVKEHSRGQRVVRFYDPDGHIIEVGEDMRAVVRRFAAAGMTAEQVAVRMDVPVGYVSRMLK